MKILVISPNACSESAKCLADNLGATYKNGFEGWWSPRNYDVVFNYGCGDASIDTKNVINKGSAVIRCVNKISTLQALTKAGVPCLEFVTDKKKIPADWDVIVVRKTVEGKKNEGLEFAYQGEPIPNAPLYTRYFEHRYEYRVVVFLGKVVARYRKVIDSDGNWDLVIAPKRGFEQMDKACINAANALGIDYVGFDVLSKNKKDFRICEANSGPILMQEMAQGVIDHFFN